MTARKIRLTPAQSDYLEMLSHGYRPMWRAYGPANSLVKHGLAEWSTCQKFGSGRLSITEAGMAWLKEHESVPKKENP